MSDAVQHKTPARRPVYQSPVTGIVPFRASLKSHLSFGDHWHSETEIFYLMPDSGAITIWIEGKPYRLAPRDMLIIPSAAVHRIEVSDTPNLVLRLDIGYPLLGENYRPFVERHFTRLHYSFGNGTDPEMSAVEDILVSISREKYVWQESLSEDSDTETVISRMRVCSLLFRLAASLLQLLPSEKNPPLETPKKHALQIIHSIIFYFREHFNEPITLEAASVMAGYEKTHFCHLFKEITGVSFHQYITDYRLEAALPLLRSTALPIASIAQSVGIPSVKTFSRLIRSRYGMSPREIRGGNDPEFSAHERKELP